MARPRTPAKILELRGAFKANPQRRRKDAEGAAPFEKAPPMALAADCVPAWHQLVSRLPKVVLSSSDEFAVEQAAVCLTGIRQLGNMAGLHPSYGKLSSELRQWLIQLGMTPAARTKIAPEKADDDAGNPFAKL
jgi:hypothetical protein